VPVTDDAKNLITGTVIHIDRFGNCITNLTCQELQANQPNAQLFLAGHRVTHWGTHFAQSAGKGELIAYIGSAGYWEIAVWCDSAAQMLGIKRGAEVVLEFR